MNQEDQRNFLIAMVLMVGLIFASQFLFNEPASRDFEDRQAAASAPTEDAGTQAAPEETAASNQPSVDTSAETAEIVSPPPQPLNVTNSDRIPFDADAVDGSIRLVGARIDDLKLKRHFKTPKRQEELVLLRPQAERNGYYATYLWRDAKERPIAGVDTVWTKISGSELGVDRPVTLRFEGGGLRIDRTISVDQDYMFTFSDAVTNIGPSEKTISTLGVIRRYGEWKEFLAATDPGVGAQSGIGFKGLIGVLDNSLNLRNYSKLDKGQGFKGETRAERTSGDGGWVGLTDKYFMTVLAPDQSTPFAGAFYRRQSEGRPVFEVWAEGDGLVLDGGETITVENRLFAGAKRLTVLNRYKDELNLPRFDDAVDWGWIYFLTKPFFWALSQLEKVTGSFGLAILALTVVVKVVFFPLFNRSYRSIAKMKKLQEPMKEINERFAADPQRKQQEIMKLFKEHKANPIGGCLPIFATMPVFFALYQTLAVTLEMRHTPFLFIDDLSAPDPTAIGNLFGLLGFLVSAETLKEIPILGYVLGLGILPVLYGLTMWALQSLNPPPTDEMQKMIIQFLPIIFTFVFAGFAAGLVVYWLWSNLLTIVQQYIIMRQNGVETELDKLIARLRGRAGDAA